MRRMLDITFRLHMGILKKSADGVKTTLAPGNLEKYVRPSKILTRLSIVRQEVFTSHHRGREVRCPKRSGKNNTSFRTISQDAIILDLLSFLISGHR